MKTGFLFLFLVIVTRIAAQSDRLAAFPGGDSAFNQYIRSHLFTTPEAKKAGVKGELAFRFTINESGKAESFTTYQRLNYGLEEQVEKLLQEMPDWEPGIINGQKIKTSFSKTFIFTDSTPVGTGSQLALKKTLPASPVARPEITAPVPPPAKKADAVENILSYLKKEFSYPKAMDKKWEGRVFVQFYLQPNGELRDIQLIKGADEETDKQIITILRNVPAFPGGEESIQPGWKVYEAEIVILKQKIRELILRPSAPY